jgi:cysteine desulfurase
MIYLDHAATTPMLPEVSEAMQPFAGANFGNPASAHAVGRKARQALEDARECIANLLGASPDELIFTSGATEANNLAIFGLAGSPPGHILASPIEHPCVTEPLKQLAARGFEIEYLPVDSTGTVTVASFQERVRPDTRLSVLMMVNHETGATQPSSWYRDLHPRLHADAAQAAGKIPISFRDLGLLAMSLSGHKFGGPKGIGALVVKKGTHLNSLFFGGHQQQGRRPGTESPMLAVGMAKALEITTSQRNESLHTTSRKRRTFISHLQETCSPMLVNSDPEGLPYIANISFPGCRADVLLMKLDLAGVACSTGSACSSGSLLPSPVLKAMGVAEDVLKSAMRFSFGPGTTEAELAEAAKRIAACVQQLRTNLTA